MSYPQVKLGDIFEIARGSSPRPIDKYITDDPNGLNWISIKDASNSSKYIYKTEKKIKPEGLNKTRQVYPDDFLLTNSMSFGRPYIMKTTGCIHDGWLVLSSNKEIVNTDFFYHLLSSDFIYRKFVGLAAGAVVKNLNTDLVKSVEVPLPPLEEQRRIAEILDKADTLIQKRKAAIAKLDELLQATFIDMFGDPVTNPKGWDTSLAKKILHIQGGYAFSSQDFTKNGIPVIKIGNANKLGFNTEKLDFINPKHPEKLKQYELRSGDLLISLTGTVGKDDYGNITEVNNDYDMYYLNQRVAKLNINLQIMCKEFSRYIFAQNSIKNCLTKNSRGIRQANISNNDIYNLVLPIPPKELQDKWAEFAKAVEEQKQVMQAQLEIQETLFKSLQQQAFSGQL